LGNYFTEMCSGSEAGSFLRLIDFVYHSTLGLRAITKKKWNLGLAVPKVGVSHYRLQFHLHRVHFLLHRRETIFIEPMTSDRKLKASREGST